MKFNKNLRGARIIMSWLPRSSIRGRIAVTVSRASRKRKKKPPLGAYHIYSWSKCYGHTPKTHVCLWLRKITAAVLYFFVLHAHITLIPMRKQCFDKISVQYATYFVCRTFPNTSPWTYNYDKTCPGRNYVAVGSRVTRSSILLGLSEAPMT